MSTALATTKKAAPVTIPDVDLNKIADRIRDRMGRETADIIATGNDLIEAKAALEHGEFTAWLDDNFAMTYRTAERYISSAKWAEGKTDIVSDLLPTMLYLLSAPSTPVHIQKSVVAKLKAGEEVNAREVKALIRQAKSETAEAGNGPDEEATESQIEAELKREEAELKREEADLNKAVEILLGLDPANIDQLLEVLESVSWELWEALIATRKSKADEVTA